jgi:universal stress protein A
MVRRILLATDGSSSSLAAARFLRESGMVGPGVRLTVLHVMVQPRARPVARAAALPGGARNVTVAATPQAQAAVDATLAALGPAGAGGQVEFVTGQPAEEIVARARADHADLIVLGKRGRSVTDDLLLGSVCERVLHDAPCAVVVVGTA